MRATKPGVHEYQMESLFLHECYSKGAYSTTQCYYVMILLADFCQVAVVPPLTLVFAAAVLTVLFCTTVTPPHLTREYVNLKILAVKSNCADCRLLKMEICCCSTWVLNTTVTLRTLQFVSPPTESSHKINVRSTRRF